MAETVFGATLTTRQVPVRLINGQHIRERLGHIPSLAD